MEALAGRGIRYKQVVSPGSSCTLQAEDLTHPFHDAASYKSAIAPIAEGAIDLDSLKPEQKVFSDYLGKAAEIVRREPYCQEIQLVNFSGSRGTRESPVIFVQYKRAENKWVNHYLTLAQIDDQYQRLHEGPGNI
jgi:hypothetical protein